MKEEQICLIHNHKIKRKSVNNKHPLKGDEWTRLSISVWNNIYKTTEEKQLKHPAIFPTELVQRLIKIFSISKNDIILDPFMGVGSTLVGAMFEDRAGIGFEIVPEFARKAKTRLITLTSNFFQHPPKIHFYEKAHEVNLKDNEKFLTIYQIDARQLLECISIGSMDMCITSPPYWDILTRKRTADYKNTRKYSDLPDDLGNITDYNVFLNELKKIFLSVYNALKLNSYAIIVVMDIRKSSTFIPYHIDIVRIITEIGFKFEDIIIWDRKHEYNQLRPLGYPYKFIVNKVHEYILIFRKVK